jgi:hypothetical protein
MTERIVLIETVTREHSICVPDGLVVDGEVDTDEIRTLMYSDIALNGWQWEGVEESEWELK